MLGAAMFVLRRRLQTVGDTGAYDPTRSRGTRPSGKRLLGRSVARQSRSLAIWIRSVVRCSAIERSLRGAKSDNRTRLVGEFFVPHPPVPGEKRKASGANTLAEKFAQSRAPLSAAIAKGLNFLALSPFLPRMANKLFNGPLAISSAWPGQNPRPRDRRSRGGALARRT